MQELFFFVIAFVELMKVIRNCDKLTAALALITVIRRTVYSNDLCEIYMK